MATHCDNFSTSGFKHRDQEKKPSKYKIQTQFSTQYPLSLPVPVYIPTDESA